MAEAMCAGTEPQCPKQPAVTSWPDAQGNKHQTTHTIQLLPSPETHRAHGASNPARPETARPSSELGAHQEELLHSLPYPQGEYRDPAEPWAHDPADGMNGEWA
ncbi:Hypothetical predicted protein [Pelobates cultripes]|uniref:Uncharacterized protein n=1 Tax=Pelobates cultripes TaxID=61616 RepID=A0AAD1QYS4_PELCU|nr:Hypothetical predicted protein [Pelobates cultripes]